MSFLFKRACLCHCLLPLSRDATFNLQYCLPQLKAFRVGQNHIYIRCEYGIFGRKITIYTVIRCIYTVLANPTSNPNSKQLSVHTLHIHAHPLTHPLTNSHTHFNDSSMQPFPCFFVALCQCLCLHLQELLGLPDGAFKHAQALCAPDLKEAWRMVVWVGVRGINRFLV